MRSGKPTSSTSMPPPTRCSAGPPTPAPGYRCCRASMIGSRGVGRPCTEGRSSMADTDIGSDSADTTLEPDTGQASRISRLRRAVVDRLPALSVTIVAGLALCVSFPPFGYWYAAILAFALLGWVLTRTSTTAAGGLGYGLLFGLVFYLPLL